jgi:hypothetical protein
MDGSWGKVKGS